MEFATAVDRTFIVQIKFKFNALLIIKTTNLFPIPYIYWFVLHF